MYKYIVLGAISFLVKCHGQWVSNGDPVFCTPPGICPDSGGIEPRIVSPTDVTPAPTPMTCPAGTVPCYAQGSRSRCGRRSEQYANDGPTPDGTHPWQAYLQDSSGRFIGGGSLLSPYHVLTAAHKVLPYVSSPTQLGVRMGVNDVSLITGQPTQVAKITTYKDNSIMKEYDNSTLKNDLAIVRVASPFNLLNQNLINTICLPPENTNQFTYSNTPVSCVVTGWGQEQPDNSASPTRRLKQVAVNTTNIDSCEAGFKNIVAWLNTDEYLDKSGGHICAGGKDQRDACFQDGGGPLIYGTGTVTSRATVIGIVSWGKSCGREGVYGVYTNVPYYRKWIVETIAEKFQ